MLALLVVALWGGALKAWQGENSKDAKIFVSDPPNGYNDDLSVIDIMSLP